MSSFKPRHTEAIARMRTNGAGLVAAVISSTLLPLPSPWTAFRVVWSSTSGGISRNVGIVWYALCAAGARSVDYEAGCVLIAVNNV